MWKVTLLLMLLLGGCRSEKPNVGAEASDVLYHEQWVDPVTNTFSLLNDLVKARRLSAEFDEPTRLMLDLVCRLETLGDSRLATFMSQWSLDAIFPQLPFLETVYLSGCGFYFNDSGNIVLPMRTLFNVTSGAK